MGILPHTEKVKAVESAETLLHTEKLTVGYDGKPILRDVTLSVRPGEILTLLGANGAGKSTLLKTLIGQLPPISGAAFLYGKPMGDMNGDEIARTLSIVMTSRVDGELLTVEDVVSSGRYPYTGRLGVLCAHDREVVADAMRRMSVEELRTRRFQRLSDGQRQRVLLARALCQEPRILVMDEPTSFLDLRYQLELLSLLRDMAFLRKIAVILSTHELEFARRVSDTVACIRGGVVERAGPPGEILTPDYIERLYDIPPGHYGGTERYSFVQNRQCEMFPCHTGVSVSDFNCLFCYCPLYALGERCGGNFSYTEKGVKNCKDCNFPHAREHYKAVIARFPELAELAKPEARRGV